MKKKIFLNNPESYIKYTRIFCALFPPILSQHLRDTIFPRQFGMESNISFTKKSVTGSFFSGNIGDFHAYRFCIHGFYDWKNVIIAATILKNNQGDIVEVGANIGTETICYTDICRKIGNVHAFEPLPDNFNSLKRLQENKRNLRIYDIAISNKKGTAFFEIPPLHESGIGKLATIDSSSKTILVRIEPLDNYLSNFKNVCLISIDTEGNDYLVLLGAVITIKKFRPIVIIEVSKKQLKKSSGSTPAQIYSFFNQKDYFLYRICSLSLKEVQDSDLNTRGISNWLCIPAEKIKVVKEINLQLKKRALLPWYLLANL